MNSLRSRIALDSTISRRIWLKPCHAPLGSRCSVMGQVSGRKMLMDTPVFHSFARQVEWKAARCSRFRGPASNIALPRYEASQVLCRRYTGCGSLTLAA